jgi:hypothetical protein
MMKKIAIWEAMVQREGKGTDVERPKYCAIGWKSLTELACGLRERTERGSCYVPDLWKLDSEVAQQN